MPGHRMITGVVGKSLGKATCGGHHGRQGKRFVVGEPGVSTKGQHPAPQAPPHVNRQPTPAVSAMDTSPMSARGASASTGPSSFPPKLRTASRSEVPLSASGVRDAQSGRPTTRIASTLPSIDREIKAVKWRLWHGRLDRAIQRLERTMAGLNASPGVGDLPAARLHSLGSQLLTYIWSNRGAIINCSKRYNAGLRVATSLAESAVNSLVAKRMVKKQQMRWSQHGAHMLMQDRTAEMNGELRDRLRASFLLPEPHVPSLFRPKPLLLRAA